MQTQTPKSARNATAADYQNLLWASDANLRLALAPAGLCLGDRPVVGPKALALEAFARAGKALSVQTLLELEVAGIRLDLEGDGRGLALKVRSPWGEELSGAPLEDLARASLEKQWENAPCKGWALVTRAHDGEPYALFRPENAKTYRRAPLHLLSRRLVEPGALYPAFQPQGRGWILPLHFRETHHTDLRAILGAALPWPVLRQVAARNAKAPWKALVETGRVHLGNLA